MKNIYKIFKENIKSLMILTILSVKTAMPDAVFSQLNISHSGNAKDLLINKLSTSKSDSMANMILKSYKQHIYFTQNSGQMPDTILYKADFKMGQALVTKKGMIVGIFDTASIAAAAEQSERREKVQSTGMQFNEAPVSIKGHGWYMKFKNSLPGMSIANKKKYDERYNYFLGNNKSKYATQVSNYGEIYYQNIYKNTDVRYYPSADGSLEYDIICKPGADPKQIELQLEGIDQLTIKNGKLRIKTSIGELDFPEPYSYQVIDGKEKKVNCNYKLSNKQSAISNQQTNLKSLNTKFQTLNTITFDVSDYDTTKPLVIDPIALRWATWISNHASINSHGHGIWVDASTNKIYVTGWYQTTGLITVGAFQNTNSGTVNLFIGCYTQPASVGGAGTRVWQTYLGGNNIDNPYAMEMGSDGNLYIIGNTTSSNYPLLGGSAFSGSSIDKRSQSGQNIFVTKMNTAGTSFKSSVIGGNQDDLAYDVRIASNGEVLVCGYTQSTNLATLFSGKGASNTNYGGTDVLIFRLSSDLSTLRWMKNFGGSSNDQANIMLTNPTNGDIFVGGQTASSNFPTLNPRQSSRGGTQSGFLMKLKSNGTTRWSSYFKASTGSTSILCMEFNNTSNKIYFGGLTAGLYTGNVSTSGVYKSTITGGTDFFVCLMDTAQTFNLGTYIGSTGSEYNMMGLNVDQNNDVYIFGYTPGTNYPVTTDALQTTNMGTNNKIFTKISSNLSTVIYSTYFGGSSDDYDPIGERGIKFSNCRIFTIVTASSNNIPLTQGAVTTNKLSSTSILEPGLVIWSNPPDLAGNVVTGTQTICNGNIPSTLSGSTPYYLVPTITRNGVLSNYPAITPSTTYQWQSSTDSVNWINVSGGNSTNLAGTLIGALSQKTYFRRIVNGDACSLPGASGVTINVDRITVSGIVTNVSCYGSSNGSIAFTASGGKTPYSYRWSNNATTQNLSNVSTGTYTVTVTDANSCSGYGTYTITQPTQIQINFTTTATSCGQSNGSATATASNAVSPYSYLWNTSASTQTISNVTGGAYTVTVTDATGCKLSAQTVVTSSNSPTINGTVTNVSCNGSSNGAITLTVTGGVTPYSYIWTDGPTTQNRTSLVAGQYNIEVIDHANCVSLQYFTVTQPTFSVATTVNSNVTCYGGNNGSVSASVTGGVSPLSYLWSSGSVTATASNLIANTYNVTVTDANSCKKTSSATVSQPAQLTATCSVVDTISCYGANNGLLQVYASGGVSPYTYLWSNAATSITINNLNPGTYTATVTDASSCKATGQSVLVQPALLVVTTSYTPVSCSISNSGTATAIVSGGTTPYRYSWSTTPVQTTATATGLTIGTYTVVVTDKNGCSSSANVTVTQIPGLTLNISSQTNVLCYGNNTGSATVNPLSGVSPYTYTWNTNPVQSVATAINLYAGTYTVTVSDHNSCKGSTNVSITQPAAALSASITSQTNILCYGNSTGSATVTASGGTSPYTYSWNSSPVQTTATASNLSAGTYTITVTDYNGCSATTSATITQPSAELSARISSQINVLCNGNNTGSAMVVASGGSSPYTYTWNTSPVQTTTVAINLSATTYRVSVTDNNSCLAMTTVTITQPSALNASISSHTNILCYGNSTGSATVTATGGTSPYTYTWNTSPVQTSQTASNIPAGTYTVTVTDNNGCKTNTSATITQPSELSSSITAQTNVLCYGNSTGSATVTALGGTSPYTYSWSNGQQSALSSQLSAGTYTVTITDNNGCKTNTSATITQPSALSARISSQINVLCNGNNTGSAMVVATGGSSPYTYAWNTIPVKTTSVAINLSATTYTVSVTDNNSCLATTTVTITQPSALNASVSSHTNVLCYGNNTGSASVTASGGTSPYTYIWNNNSTTSNISNLISNVYFVTVTDHSNCKASATVTITQPTALISSITSKTDVLCNGNSTGSATVTASGGTSPYTYIWSNGQQSAVSSQLPVGIYKVTVTDDNSCKIITNVTITQPPLLIAKITSTKGLCYGDNSGTGSVTASGGTPPFHYSWSNGQQSAVSSQLSTGTYTVTVTDNNGCKATANTSIVQYNPPVVSIDPTNSTICQGTNITYTATTTGTSPFSYKWFRQIFPIPGQIGSKFSIQKVSLSDANQYYCSATNLCGTSKSNIAYLSVNNFSIISQPSNTLTHAGGDAIFSVIVNDTNATYQWQQNGVNIYDNTYYSGTHTNQLTIINCPLIFNNYSYRCIVSGSQCSNQIISNSGILTVNQLSIAGLWTGAVSNDWYNPANWDTGVVPDKTTNVIIQSIARFQPLIYNTDTALCHNLTVNAGASLLVKDGGYLKVAGRLYIKSDESGDGSFASERCCSYNVHDSATVEKFLAKTGYHYIVTPIEHTSIRQIDKSVKLYNLGYGYFDPDHPPTAKGICNIWYMIEPHSDPDDPTDQHAWLAPSSLNHIMLDMRGYALNVPSDNVTLSFSGTSLNNCSISTPLTHLGNGINFVGNPYTSPVDWNLAFNDLSPHVNGTMIFFNRTSLWYGAWAYFNPLIGTWGAFKHTQYLPAMQAFYLYCDSASILTFHPSYKTVANDAIHTDLTKAYDKNVIKYPLISFKSYNPKTPDMSDQAVIYFVSDATEKIDMKYDCPKMFNTDDDIPNIYTISDNNNIAINALPLSILNSQSSILNYSIPFNYKVKESGKYYLKVEDMMNFDSGLNVYLVDTKENMIYELAQGQQIALNITASDDENRFYIKFSALSTQQSVLSSSEIFNAYSDNTNLYVKYFNSSLKQGTLNVYSIDGKNILQNVRVENGTHKFNIEKISGIYFVKMTTDDNVYVKKIYLK